MSQDFATLIRDLAEGAAGQRAQLEVLRREVAALQAQADGETLARSVRGLDRQIEQLRNASVRQHRRLSQALKEAGWLEELRVDERRLRARLARMKRSSRPVLVGPWSGEVGFELLYWIPFVTWALREAEVAPERIVIVSRGGPRSWYAHLGGRYVDALAHISPAEFRAQTEAVKKQRRVGAFDRQILAHAMRAAGVTRPRLLHPGLMYRLFYPFWKQKTTVQRVARHTAYQFVTRPRREELDVRLPTDYIAVRFYFSDAFPDTPANRQFVDAALRALSASSDIVLLNTGFHIDDHRDYAPSGGRIHTIADLMVPEHNLEVQTAVIAGARAFVGTYGGYAYLAPLCGVPSVAFHSVRDSFFVHHLELAVRVFRQLGAPSLVTLDVQDTDLIRMALAASAGLPS